MFDKNNIKIISSDKVSILILFLISSVINSKEQSFNYNKTGNYSFTITITGTIIGAGYKNFIDGSIVQASGNYSINGNSCTFTINFSWNNNDTNRNVYGTAIVYYF